MPEELTPSLKIPVLHSNIPVVSPDGQDLLAVAWLDKHLRIYDANTGKEKTRLDGFTIPTMLEFSPDGSMMAMAGWLDPTRIWDAKTWEIKHDFEHPAQYLAYSPDGKSIAVSWKRKLTVYDLTTGQPKSSFQDTRRIDLVKFTRDGKTIITGPGKETKFWDATTGAPIGSVKHQGDIMMMCISPDGNTLATCGSKNRATLWDLKTKENTVLQHQDLVAAIDYSPDGKHIATGDFSGNITVWDATGQQLTTFKPANDVAIYRVAFSPTGEHFVAMNGNHVMSLWETRTWKCLGTESKPATATNPMRPANFSPQCPAWSPNGKRFAVAGGDSLNVYDV